MIKLSERLKTIAFFIPPGDIVADIGTDHALLPCYLVKEGISPRVIATDVNKGPLKTAQNQVKGYNLEDKVNLRLGNGLKVLSPKEVDTVIIAGMGGGTIRDILNASPEVVNSIKRFILQPNVGGEIVRKWALNNFWKIKYEELVYEEERFYEIIVLEKGKMELEDEIYFILGPKLVETKNINLVPYLKKQKEAEQEIIKNLEKSKSDKALNKAKEIRQKWEKIGQVLKCRLNVEI